MCEKHPLKTNYFIAKSFFIVFTLLIAFTPIQEAHAQDTNPEAIIHNLKYNNGPVGFDIYLTMDINNAANQSVWVAIWFKDENGNGIVHAGGNYQYRDVAGFLTSQQEALPAYEYTRYESFEIHIPYEEFPGDVDQLFAIINVTLNGQMIGYYESSEPINFSPKSVEDYFPYDNDDDQDGLNNQFEFNIMNTIKPKFVYDEEEHNILLGQDPDDFEQLKGVVYLYQVSPASCKLDSGGNAVYASFSNLEDKQSPSTVLLTIVAIYPYDYLPWKNKWGVKWGEDDYLAHHGDVETLKICLRNNSNNIYELDFIHVRRHGGDHTYRHGDLEWEFYNTSDHPVLYVSEGKHATYASEDECEDAMPWYQEAGWDEDCGGGKEIWPIAYDKINNVYYNVGEYSPGKALTLDDFGLSEHFKNTASHIGSSYVNEYIWTPYFEDKNNRQAYFCGGIDINDFTGSHNVIPLVYDAENCPGGLHGKWWQLAAVASADTSMDIPTGTTTNSTTTTGVCMEQDTDRYGSDYTYFELPNPDPNECVEACVKDTNCVSYAYVPPGLQADSALCYLKNTAPSPSPMVRVISGLRSNCLK